MDRTAGTVVVGWIAAFALGTGISVFLASAPVQAQVFSLTREELIEFTTKNPFERFPDGRPKIPDAMIERARGLSMEEILSIGAQGYRNQYVDGWQVLQPGKKLVGRAFTVQFMPSRPDLDRSDGVQLPGAATTGLRQ